MTICYLQQNKQQYRHNSLSSKQEVWQFDKRKKTNKDYTKFSIVRENRKGKY